MSAETERRRARRIAVNIPTVVEVVGHHEVDMHDNLAKVYERVPSNHDALGKKFPATVRDLSTNGVFITGEALPLLSRVTFRFSLDGFGPVDALGWTLWRRTGDCELPRQTGTVALHRGFGILLEAIPLDARIAIHGMVSAATIAE